MSLDLSSVSLSSSTVNGISSDSSIDDWMATHNTIVIISIVAAVLVVVICCILCYTRSEGETQQQQQQAIQPTAQPQYILIPQQQILQPVSQQQQTIIINNNIRWMFLYESRKAIWHWINAFYWRQLMRQVFVLGHVSMSPPIDDIKYRITFQITINRSLWRPNVHLHHVCFHHEKFEL